jgi:uncharacterized membrane protein
MAEPVRGRVWHLVRELRDGFVLRPGAITLTMAVFAIGLTSLEERITGIPLWSNVLDRIFPPEPAAAHVVLGTISGSMITVVSVVYSILLVVLTFASTQFSPRVLVAFVEDRVSQATLGVFVGIFTYCLLTLRAVARSGYIQSVDEGRCLPWRGPPMSRWTSAGTSVNSSWREHHYSKSCLRSERPMA